MGAMEGITSWERKGRAEGLREGRAEGLREGQRLVVERMLTRRFGALPLLRGVGFWEVPSFPLSFRASGCPDSPFSPCGRKGSGG
jgi:predicted transposase YdaD